MFDSVPTNLPFEPAAQNSQPVPPQAVTHNPESGKEPEDIFAGIKEPQAPIGHSPVAQAPVAKKAGSKILALVIIPLIVIGLGVGGWYLYHSFAKGVIYSSPKQPQLQATIPATAEPDNESETMQNPIPLPDDTSVAASQASIGILKAQQDMEAERASGIGTSTEQVVNIPVIAQDDAPGITQDSNVPAGIGAGEGVGMILSGKDGDLDGLTDTEELLLGSDSTIKDSDGDGFEDLSEVKNGYDPASNRKLAQSNSMKFEDIGTLEFLLPKSWVKKVGLANTVDIETGTPATINVATENFADTRGLLPWLLEKFPGSSAQDYVVDRAKDGSSVVFSNDLTKAWLLFGNAVYSFRYSTNGQPKEFGVLMDVMLKQAQPLK